MSDGMVYAYRNSSGALAADFSLDIFRRAARVHVDGLWGFCHDLARVGGDQLPFALVPFRQDFRGGRAAQNARMDQACEAHTGDVARGAEDTFEIPDCFGADNQLAVSTGLSSTDNYTSIRIIDATHALG